MPDLEKEYNSDNTENKNLEKEFTDIFGSSSFSDDDLLKVVEKHTLQLNAQQIKSILWLYSFDNPLISMVADKYLEIKHHNKSGELIIQALGAISLRKFISQFRFNINTTK
ncbi:hypothetical protein A2771_01715 [Candidatus Woesebacteria bacterium RIFCSPHIGHO2_01_FULL_38_26b]|uniref:Uncharacterized protein n=1 Tax=Candidatus Woesebacteria bacterium RIFCSPHIGHO2_01_FULL_38_26b TaxID=1802491 RepID=A0A1F7XXT8_9BACT|nr:MAG: hypothetical protein A2771_01715 [Candidatus Woesebacteria bacterium RIFCSPHIGHO2_01_FULL_38_26b]